MIRGLCRKACDLGIGLTLLVVMAGCGGGGTPAPSPTPVVAVSITTPTTAQTVLVNGTVPITAAVSGTTNTALTWAVNGVTNGNSTFGTITGSGLSVTYNAPAAVPTPATFNVTATSVADNTKFASVSVTISVPVAVSITNPTTAQTVLVNGTLLITAAVSGTTNTAVTWAVNGVNNGNSTFGTITGSGLSVTYNAPAAVPAPATFNVTATSNADASKSASLQVTITVGGGSVTVTQTSLNSGTVGVSYSQQLSATGGTSPYTWSITAGALPVGLTLSTGGLIAGTPIAAGGSGLPVPAFSFTVQATDSTSGTHLMGTQVLNLTIIASTTAPNGITVMGGIGHAVTGVDFPNLTTMTPTLGLSNVGLCTPTCKATVATITITHGTNATVWLLGQGLTTGSGTAISTLSVSVSGTNDVTVTGVSAQALYTNGGALTPGLTNITFTVTATSGATPGPRNIIVTNSATGETQAFIGAIQIQ